MTEQQRRKRRVVKSMSELRVDDNQYIIHLAECENGENPVIMVDDLHDAIPENQKAENCGEIAAGYDVNKLIRRSKRQMKCRIVWAFQFHLMGQLLILRVTMR